MTANRQPVIEAIYNSLGRALRPTGFPAAEAGPFLTWLGQSRSDDFHSATIALLYSNNAQPIRSLAEEYLSTQSQHHPN